MILGRVFGKTALDRNGSFESQLVKKHQTHFDGFDEKIISMYARGMTVREIQGHLQELRGGGVAGPDLASDFRGARGGQGVAGSASGGRVPDRVSGCFVIKVRDQGTVPNRSADLAIGVNADGKEILGLWLEETEVAKFWL